MVNRIDFSEVDVLNKYRLTWEKRKIISTCEFEEKEPVLYDKLTDNFKIIQIEKVFNPYLYGLYKLRKEETKIICGSVKTEKLFHATSPSNAIAVIQTNFDWRRTERSRFGKGVCFSPCPWYANKYASRKGAFIISKVLVGGIQKVGVNYEMQIPSEYGADTTVCYGNDVYVKYNDYEYYPLYVVEYK